VQWFITCPLSAYLPFQSLFTESLHGDQLLASPPTFSGVLRAPAPSAACSFSVPSLLLSLGFFGFFFFFFFFFAGQGSACPGGYAGLSQG
jgi:hypothetical protein